MGSTPLQVYRGLYISDLTGVSEGDTSSLDRVISVCQNECSDSVACEYEHYPMDDGYGERYSYEILSEAIDAVVAARIRRDTVCVHCHAGVSRSAAVCIGALGVVEGMTYDEAYDIVSDTKYIQPTREMLEHAERYIEERHG
jgi:Dual specificity phosphatase, catalytic domain.